MVKFYPLLPLLPLLLCAPAYAQETPPATASVAAMPAPVTPLAAQIAQNMKAQSPAQKVAGVRLNWKRLDAFYAARQYQPCWLSASSIPGPSPFLPQATQMAEFLSHVDEEGLTPEDYAATPLAERLKAPGAADENLMTELLLSDRAMQYISDVKTGHANPTKIIPDITLPPRDYDIPGLLTQALATKDVGAAVENLAPAHSEYAQLRKKLAEYRAIAAAGNWPQLPAGAALKPGMNDPHVPMLYERLQREAYLPKGAVPADTHYSDALVQAVQAFQRDHDVKPDGAIGAHTVKLLNVTPAARVEQLRLNMERWRWLPEDLGARHLLINIAGFDLEAVENNHTALEMRVIVGQQQHRTPVFSSTMSEVIFHPYWYAPKRLGIEDILPQLRKDPSTAESKGFEMLRVEDGKRTKVNLSSIDLHKLSKADLNHYTFRQRPGPKNALGAIKFRVANNDDIYLHDTSNPKLFASDTRSLSNGCIRLGQPQALAEFVLKDLPDWPQSRIDAVYNAPITPDTEPTAVVLPQPLPVHIMYFTVRADANGHIHFYDDIYKWDQKLSSHDL